MARIDMELKGGNRCSIDQFHGGKVWDVKERKVKLPVAYKATQSLLNNRPIVAADDSLGRYGRRCAK